MTRPAPNPQNLDAGHKGVLIHYGGEARTAAQWADFKGMGRTTLYMRLKRGMSIHTALTRPVFKNGRVLVTDPIRNWVDSVPRKLDKNKVHPIAYAIYSEMTRERWSYRRLAERAGVSVSMICNLKRNGPGYFVNIEALATTLGLTIKVVKERKSDRDLS